MDVQATPSPYASLGAAQPAAGNPPALGQQVPGHTGGLPAQGGLSVLANPMAEELRSKGRGEDTMLVHMTPNEVNSLQGLAMAHGGSLTINPETGLPEAGWLGKLLPTILGGVLAATGVGAPLAAGIIGLGQTAITGDLQKGLMAGLGAFGGASLAGAAGLGGAISKNAFGVLGDKAGILGANMGAGAGTVSGLSGATQETLRNAAMQGAQGAQGAATAAMPSTATPAFAEAFGNMAAPGMAGTQAAMQAAAANVPAGAFANTASAIQKTMPATGFLGKFGEAARAGLPGGVIGKAAPIMAAQGLLSNVSDAMTPTVKTAEQQTDNSYTGPYTAQRRTATFAPSTADLLASTKERRYFDVDMPEVYDIQGRLVQPGSSTAPGTPILQNVLAPDIVKKGLFGSKTVKNANKYMQQWSPYMLPEGTMYAEGGEVAPPDKGIERNYKFKQLESLTPSGPAAASRPTGKMSTLMAMRDERLGKVMGLKGAAQAAKLRANQPQPSPELARAVGGGSSRLQDMRNVNAFNDGGEVKLADGAFVVDARTVSELGNGSSNAGIEMLSRMGGRPVRGPGDGVSDSVPARIGRDQPARVARDEVIFDPEAVRRIGKGNEKRGADKLYAMMDKAHKARKRAGRGSDTKLRKGLA